MLIYTASLPLSDPTQTNQEPLLTGSHKVGLDDFTSLPEVFAHCIVIWSDNQILSGMRWLRIHAIRKSWIWVTGSGVALVVRATLAPNWPAVRVNQCPGCCAVITMFYRIYFIFFTLQVLWVEVKNWYGWWFMCHFDITRVVVWQRFKVLMKFWQINM